MRLGKVKVSLETIVDLDNPTMVERAKEAMYEDIYSCIKWNSLMNLITVEHAPYADENEIPDHLKDEDE